MISKCKRRRILEERGRGRVFRVKRKRKAKKFFIGGFSKIRLFD